MLRLVQGSCKEGTEGKILNYLLWLSPIQEKSRWFLHSVSKFKSTWNTNQSNFSDCPLISKLKAYKISWGYYSGCKYNLLALRNCYAMPLSRGNYPTAYILESYRNLPSLLFTILVSRSISRSAFDYCHSFFKMHASLWWSFFFFFLKTLFFFF